MKCPGCLPLPASCQDELFSLLSSRNAGADPHARMATAHCEETPPPAHASAAAGGLERMEGTSCVDGEVGGGEADSAVSRIAALNFWLKAQDTRVEVVCHGKTSVAGAVRPHSPQRPASPGWSG